MKKASPDQYDVKKTGTLWRKTKALKRNIATTGYTEQSGAIEAICLSP